VDDKNTVTAFTSDKIGNRTGFVKIGGQWGGRDRQTDGR
jgi:hypothetical protein